MTTEVQWKCKEPHKECEGKDWKFYKLFSETDAKDFIERIGPNSKHFFVQDKSGAVSTKMKTFEEVFRTVAYQTAVYPSHFLGDGPMLPSKEDDTETAAAIKAFYDTPITPDKGENIKVIGLRLRSKNYCHLAEESLESMARKMFSEIKRMVVVAVGMELRKGDVLSVVGVNREVLFGEWGAVSTSDEGLPVFYFTCDVNLVVNRKI